MPPACNPPCLPGAAVLLVQAAKQWQEAHGGQLPTTYPDRAAFKDILKSWQRHIDGIPLEVCAGGPADRVGAGGWSSRAHSGRWRADRVGAGGRSSRAHSPVEAARS